MTYRSSFLPGLAAVLLISLPCCCEAEDWQPISGDELNMTSEPLAPGAPAVYLYRQTDRDDSLGVERVYERIKILTEAGRDRANIEIRYDGHSQSVNFIKARLIRPDGTISNFDGKVDDKALVSLGNERVMAKTFTLPLATVGSIIDLRYTLQLDPRYVYDSRWILNTDLFTRYAKFSLVPAANMAVTYSWPRGLPPETDGPNKKGGRVELETRNVPAFVTEEYMPPEDELKSRVDFVYGEDDTTLNPVEYWKNHGKKMYREAEHFMDEPRAMTRAVAQIVSPADDAETKLRKLYARVQQLRNLDATSDLTEQERAKFKINSDVEDVWDRGYGSGNQLTLLYAALVRAAGINAAVVYVSTRDRFFFNHQVLNATMLNGYVVQTTFDGRTVYLDPGVPFTKFGMLPWFESSVEGLQLDKEGGTWLKTPLNSAAASQIARQATLTLDSGGTLSGTLRVTYKGLDASSRRYSEHLSDAAARTKFLEDEVRSSVPVGLTVTLTSQPDWDSPDQPLIADFDISIPGWAQRAGRRMLLPMEIFGGDDRHTFEHAEREHPVYFKYLNQRVDDLDITLPSDYQLASLPAEQNSNLTTMAYHIGLAKDGNTIQVQRSLINNALFIPTTNYGSLRNFFQSVRAGDEQQLVLDYDPSPVHH